ncbi:MAG: SGNH/GDSL hydrolase family protein [Patescibacteria group bacterium]
MEPIPMAANFNKLKFFNFLFLGIGLFLLAILLFQKSADPVFFRYSSRLLILIWVIAAADVSLAWIIFYRIEALLKIERGLAPLMLVMLFSIIFVELFLRVTNLPANKLTNNLPNLRMTLQPAYKILPGLDPQISFTTDSLGFRTTKQVDYGNKPENTIRVIAIGGSAAESFYIDDQKTWPSLLGGYLDKYLENQRSVEVINAGRSGEYANQHLAKMKDYLKFSPNIYVVLLGFNDMTAYFQNLYRNNIMGAKEFVSSFDKFYDSSIKRVRSARIYRLFSLSYRILFQQKSFPTIDTHGQVVQSLRDLVKSAQIIDLPAESLKADTGFRGTVADIAAFCNKEKIQCILMTQPTIYFDKMPADLEGLIGFAPKLSGFKFSTGQLAKIMEAYNDVLLESAENSYVHVIDLAKNLPKDQSVFYDDVHFNNLGSEKVAKKLFEFILKEKVL